MPIPTAPFTPSRRWALRAGALAALTLGLSGCASPVVAQTSPLQLEVVDRNSGETLNLLRHQGRSYVAGVPGTRYALRLANRSAQRILVVLSVDGVNVISGETAAWNQTGYVIEPWQTHDITGWRKSDTAIAAFEFAALSDSYAALTGRPGNVGVIGAAVFLERPVPPPMSEAPMLRQSAPRAALTSPPPPAAPMAKASAEPAADSARAEASGSNQRDAAVAKLAAPRERLGTGHGQQEWSVSRRTRFERASSNPASVVEIAYDSYDNLVAAGVIPRRYYAQPRPFPQSDVAAGYVPDPPRR